MRIHITENAIENARRNGKYMLAPFIYNIVKTHSTPLGDNPIFKPEGDTPFDYTLLKGRYRDIIDSLDEYGIAADIDTVRKRYNELHAMCEKKESLHKEQLENLVRNAVNAMFAIPIETVNLECEITGDVKPKHSVIVKPEPIDTKSFRFKDTDDIEDMTMSVMKRRFLDCVIMGGAITLSGDEAFYLRELYNIDSELIPIYREMSALYGYLLFNVQPKISDKNTKLNGYVEVTLGDSGEKVNIKAQGQTFPILLHETIKGLMELFIAKGLPSNPRRANMIVKQADYMLAEPWDMRMGPKLWEIVTEGIDETTTIPYYIAELSKLTTDDFVKTLREIIADTDAGETVRNEVLGRALGYKEENDGCAKERQKDIKKNILSDEYINGRMMECELKNGSGLFSDKK